MIGAVTRTALEGERVTRLETKELGAGTTRTVTDPPSLPPYLPTGTATVRSGSGPPAGPSRYIICETTVENTKSVSWACTFISSDTFAKM